MMRHFARHANVYLEGSIIKAVEKLGTKGREVVGKKIILFAAFVWVFSAASAHAAVVYLKDGGTLRGTIVSATAGDVQLHTDQGAVTISTDRIQRIDYNDDGPQAPAPSETPPPQRSSP